MQITNTLGKYALVPLTFAQDNVAASQTGTALVPIEVASAAGVVNVAYTAPFAGEIIAVTANVSTAAGAGSLTVNPTIATTAVSTPALVVTTAAVGTAKARRGSTPFAANAAIGCKITTTGAWDATSSDLIVQVWVLLKISGI